MQGLRAFRESSDNLKLESPNDTPKAFSNGQYSPELYHFEDSPFIKLQNSLLNGQIRGSKSSTNYPDKAEDLQDVCHMSKLRPVLLARWTAQIQELHRGRSQDRGSAEGPADGAAERVVQLTTGGGADKARPEAEAGPPSQCCRSISPGSTPQHIQGSQGSCSCYCTSSKQICKRA